MTHLNQFYVNIIMSRKRDTNWSRDEISVLLDSIVEITKTRASDGKKTNSREVFEYAAKKMGEKGHPSRAEREKCRTKWKKMKEEFTHAKRARDGDSRYKEAPGIQPFYERLEEFINGSYDNISPHSTIVRRTSSLSSSRQSSHAGQRASARIAANTNGTSNDNNDTSSTIVTRTNISTEFPPNMHTSPSSRQNSRNNDNNTNTTNSSTIPPTNTDLNSQASHHHQQQQHHHNQQQQQQAIANGGLCTIYAPYSNSSNNTTTTNNNNGTTNASAIASTNLLSSNDPIQVQTTEHADISYRVSTGFRQITIFGDHDVDIKFRRDCVTINKIDIEFPNTES